MRLDLGDTIMQIQQSALRDDSNMFYKCVLPHNKRPSEEIDPQIILGERFEVPMHIKKPRCWPKSPVSRSPHESTADAPLSIPSPVLCDKQVSISTEDAPFNCLQDTIPSPVVSPSTSFIDEAVPSPAEFIECGGTGQNKFNDKKHLTELKIENILNYGSDEEDESEDELMLPTFVPRVERIHLSSEEAESDVPPFAPCALVPSFPSAPSTSSEPSVLSAPSALPGPSTFSAQYNTPTGPEQFLFDWKAFPATPIPPKDRRETFSASKSPARKLLRVPSPEKVFMTIWDNDIMDHIVTETNKYAEEEISNSQLGAQSRLNRWSPTSVDELYVYFGILLAMGFCCKSDVKEYWSSRLPICDTPNFRKYMSYNRFVLLNKFLHFVRNDNSIHTLSPSEAKIYKIKPIADHLNHKFETLYNLKQNICIDESLTQWKGRLSINQFIKNKATSIGIKTFEVCDAKSGYLWRFEIYSGHKESSAELPTPLSGFIPKLVLRLLHGLENRGHCVWMDNYYNSPALARTLKSIGFDCVGTLRTNRQYVPPQLSYLKKDNMAVGEVQGCTSGDVDILVWRDQNRVATISTYHGNAVQCVNGTYKPIVVLDYKSCMGGVDRKDQKLAMYPIERKRTRVWYKKLFKRLLNVSVLNSFIIHSEFPEQRHPFPKFTTHRDFRIELINKLLSKKNVPIIPATTRCGVFSEDYFKHLPKEYPAIVGRGREKLRRVCVVCHKRTHVFCPGCSITLCPFTCFSDYHATKRVQIIKADVSPDSKTSAIPVLKFRKPSHR